MPGVLLLGSRQWRRAVKCIVVDNNAPKESRVGMHYTGIVQKAEILRCSSRKIGPRSKGKVVEAGDLLSGRQAFSQNRRC